MMAIRFPGRRLLVALWCLFPVFQVMAEQDVLVLDVHDPADQASATGTKWRLVTDGVMGGVSEGRLGPASMEGRPCLRLQGEVRLENNGGFIQAALDVPDAVLAGIDAYQGIFLEVHGKGESYNVHLRTRDLWLPWQSYRTTFTAMPRWQTLYLPFAGFEAYRTGKALDIRRLERVGIVAIGRAFSADLCIGKIGFYP